jgi:hypothetical protein
MTTGNEATEKAATRHGSRRPAGKPVAAGSMDRPLSLVLRGTNDGKELLRSRIVESDVADGFGELWLQEFLRKGRPDVIIDGLRFRVCPILAEGKQSACAGIGLEASDDAGRIVRRELPVAALQDVSLRMAQQLITQGVLQQQDTYTYEVVADSTDSVTPDGRDAEDLFKVTIRNPPLRYATCKIAPLLEQARAVGATDDGWFPVFYTESSLQKAERFARKGAQQQPPVETGCVLVGPVCSCPESGEFFAVVSDVLELIDAEGTKFSLAYTGKTWARIQTVVRAMQSQPATSAYRMLGQAHGHNWLPLNGAPPCENCSKLEVCGRTTVFVSLDDRTWTRCVFSRQPWHLCHIYGLNARNEQVQGLFGLRDNQLQPRGYYVIPAF